MPRSFLVKKHEEIRSYQSYKPRVDDTDAVIVPDSIFALTPYTPVLLPTAYTPALLPLTVKLNNGK
ncbi:hypothetical protein DPMN_177716 [Dreissena polymorpha]|uniref:Uncharacterized protein n=1 Tax=Dreissena polymorpha TaxID=45954 RepID=A0A9D4EDJ4_DREPO|nr:hypothetical protein DPMN_177716 [Dreissena polymorpha]